MDQPGQILTNRCKLSVIDNLLQFYIILGDSLWACMQKYHLGQAEMVQYLVYYGYEVPHIFANTDAVLFKHMWAG